ncbi:hypothetical protein IQ265_28125 [Nodosilinea sp. LEGE 06152]|uniref:hypothetical protein n=1 Tax=Nodosilinea sp. LEGE 06152 TaxID=2777966 RepID=UPI00187ECEA2|nr:hypothetical protein [Nodosilinea sp. LEGE 06152]MBE9160660.1 hypothetical protein [Nodosilinea sp. LEGE 06152]
MVDVNNEQENTQRFRYFEKLRYAVWDSLLETKTNTVYWSVRAKDIQQFDQRANVLSVVLSLSTVASILTSIDLLWKILSIILSILSVAIPIINWSEKAGVSSELARKWGESFNEYYQVWMELEFIDFEIAQNEEINSIKKKFELAQTAQLDLIGKDLKVSNKEQLWQKINQEADQILRRKCQYSEDI